MDTGNRPSRDVVDNSIKPGRITQLDTLRATLMLLGIVIHSSFVFVTEQSWMIAAHNVSSFFNYLTLSIHAFRMPAFFLLSGFLYALVLARSNSIHFFDSRFRRIAIPLFTAGVALNLIQIWLAKGVRPEFGDSVINFRGCESVADVLSGCWTLHLWFLVVLLYYFIIGFPLVRLLKAFPAIPFPGPKSFFWIISIIFFLIITQVVISLSYRGFFNIFIYFPFLNHRLFYVYLPFFLIGIVLAFAKEGPSRWTQFGSIAFVLLIVSWILLLWNFNPDEHSITRYLRQGRYTIWLSYAVAFQTAAFLIVMASRLPQPSVKTATYLGDASYTIYLVHHVLVFFFALWLTNIQMSIGIQFLALVIIVSIVSWAIHHYVVRRSWIATCLMNGRFSERFRP